jgi:hypothetical protein
MWDKVEYISLIKIYYVSLSLRVQTKGEIKSTSYRSGDVRLRSREAVPMRVILNFRHCEIINNLRKSLEGKMCPQLFLQCRKNCHLLPCGKKILLR